MDFRYPDIYGNYKMTCGKRLTLSPMSFTCGLPSLNLDMSFVVNRGTKITTEYRTA